MSAHVTFSTLRLASPLVLVPGNSLDKQLRDKSRIHPVLPAVEQLARDLNALGDGVPARIDDGGGRRDASLLVHTSTYRLRLYPTDRRTGYFISAVDPVRLRDHNELAKSSLLVRPPGWQVVFGVRAIPQGADAGWEQLRKAWRRLGTVSTEHRESSAPDPARTAFLDSVGRLVDATQRITTREERRGGPYPYAEVTSTGGQRHGRHAMYEFRLAESELPREGTFVEVRGEEEMRGQVTRGDGRSVTVRFDQPVSWDHIPRQGELAETPSSVVFDKQREALALLGSGRAGNPLLLPALVEHRVRPLRPAPVTPGEALDPDQLTAFRKALATEDVLVVLGPPGTGKTRTITQIAHACATGRAGGRTEDDASGRVLVTSHTNRAVDNVLAKLPRDLVVIRVGNDGKVSQDGRPYLLEQQIGDLTGEISQVMAQRVTAYAQVEPAQAWTDELARVLERLDRLMTEEMAAAAEVTSARAMAGGPVQERLNALTTQREHDQDARNEVVRRIERAEPKYQRAHERSEGRMAGWFFRPLAQRWHRQLDGLRARDEELRAALTALDTDLAATHRELERVTHDAPAVRSARDAWQKAIAHRADCQHKAYDAADLATAAIAALEPLPPLERTDDVRAAHSHLRARRSWLGERLPLLAERRRLLTEWKAAVAAESEQLLPELIRYAHVVGATCIGTASRPELSGIDFDLAIVDEAGQIGIADALVPLVRARRGVLVGDHKQLPPFLDTEVADWGKDITSPEVRSLMTKSALERLVDGLPGSHVVQLNLQRRMPVEIAGFVSTAFYGGLLRTEHDHPHHDPLFSSPIAFVDTGELPARERQELSGRRAGESFGRTGVLNRCEARLLARLAAFYHRRGGDWAVIVPYRAQVSAVVTELTGLIGDAQRAREGVGTVDSFQGGEREVVLYGFTRSNPQGRIGFLKELRRANVAFTRAQRQLVLVGDLGTLLRADDPDFRALAQDLHTHLRRYGDIRSHEDVMALLAKAATEGDGV
ncbi:AAA domain-containing protein [Streptomyces sp. NPDC001642]|uniref:DEAD/DEAH box helicase n=1 Tax=Streptomyces sp. NPDC001642 TaxID=3154392 RepID=UPI0033181132